jgi:hypothetical protein
MHPDPTRRNICAISHDERFSAALTRPGFRFIGPGELRAARVLAAETAPSDARAIFLPYLAVPEHLILATSSKAGCSA